MPYSAGGRIGTAPIRAQEEYTPTFHEEDVHTDADTYGNQTRTLQGTRAAFKRPWHRDKRWWIRWPAQAWHFTGQRFIRRGRRSEFQLASYWWSRWPGYVRRKFQRSRGFSNDLLRPLLQSYLNLLLVFLPVALVAAATPWIPDAVFILNFLAIIPLSGLANLACEDLSANMHPTLGKLLVAFSDNLVELIVGIVALCKGEIRLVQLSMIGSVLCYSLLIMGSCFLVGGMRFIQQKLNDYASGMIISLNLTALCWFLIPSTLYVSTGQYATNEVVLFLSRGIAITLLVLYILYLLFSLKTHKPLFSDEPGSDEEDVSAEAANLSLGPIAAIVWLAVSFTCVTLCTVALVSSIRGSTWKVKKPFLAIILFPFLANVTDYLSACTVALKDEMDIVIRVTIGSSLQLLLFTIPILVILGWIINEPMTLRLDLFESATVFLGVFTVSYVVAAGKSNYLSGAMCIALYAIIALAAFLYTDDLNSGLVPTRG